MPIISARLRHPRRCQRNISGRRSGVYGRRYNVLSDGLSQASPQREGEIGGNVLRRASLPSIFRLDSDQRRRRRRRLGVERWSVVRCRAAVLGVVDGRQRQAGGRRGGTCSAPAIHHCRTAVTGSTAAAATHAFIHAPAATYYRSDTKTPRRRTDGRTDPWIPTELQLYRNRTSRELCNYCASRNVRITYLVSDDLSFHPD